ncbi:MAG: PP2C family protein-serine/threonine phosphatase, partial [Bacteroidia bacterium]
LFKILNESLFNSEKASQIAELQIKFNNEQKEKLRDLEQKAKDAEQKVKVNRLQFLIASSIIILLITLLFSFFIYRGYRNKKKAHEEISKKNEIIESKSKEIIDSINYAKHLQDAILPPHKLIREHLPSYFILYKPKDIVAGDFYWFEKIKDSGQILIAAADCTGHGVPGAMVSVVCSNALNRTVKEFKITQPGKILDKVRELVVETFEKSESEVKDGMDISIASFLMDEMKLEWAGANNPLWIIRSGELIEYKADKQSVGKTDHSEIFTNQSILLKKNDTIYLFSDGYADQFGGNKGKKFKTSKMKELFLSVQNETMEDQQMLIDRAFESWKGNNDQVDDVCIIGIRI